MSRFARRIWRWPVIVGVVVLAIAGGGVAWAMSRSGGSSSGSSQLVAARYETISSTVSASGTIEPAHQADLDFASAGRVSAVLVKAGDAVTKGEALARIGRASLVAAKDAAAETKAAAVDRVSEDGSASATQQGADAASLSAARSALHSAGVALADATLRSTIAGTVTASNLTVGEQVSGGSTSTGTGSGIDSAASNTSTSDSTSSQVEVQSSRSFIVDAAVDDTEISSVKKGQQVDVTPAGATTAVPGTVTSVSSVPSSSSGVVTFPVVVAVSGHPTGVYAGAGATLSIATRKSVRALVIPTLAIRYNGSNATVQVSDGGHDVTRAITVGSTYGLETQVLSGVASGEKVVVTLPTFGRGPVNRGGSGGSGGFGGFGGSGGSGGFGGFGGGGGFGGAPSGG